MSMKIEQSVGENTVLHLEGEDIKDVFRQLASASEIFGAADKCGACGNKNVRFVVRNVPDGKKTYEFFELWCLNNSCRARLAFGQTSDGDGLFPKRRDDSGFKPNNGWEKYDPQAQK
jgi:hypothetical protein